MIDRGKRSVVGVNIDVVDYASSVNRIVSAARARHPYGVSALAVHGVMIGALNPEQKYRLNRLHLATPDGQPVRWALRLLHGELIPDRVYGPKLMLMVCARAAQEGLAIFLFGSQWNVLRALTDNVKRRFPNLNIVGMEPSKFRSATATESLDIDERIRASGADIVFVGLGCPRQEVFVYEHASSLSRPVIAVGAAFDFHAGMLKQAPKWMSDRGLEWVFRLSVEPKRLWRRYIFLNPLFFLLVAAQYFRIGRRWNTPEAKPSKHCDFA